MNLLCLFGFHDWGQPKNIREQKPGPEILFAPILFLYAFCGRPKECDRTCTRCDTTQTVPYPIK
jgi:hypothetical protein